MRFPGGADSSSAEEQTCGSVRRFCRARDYLSFPRARKLDQTSTHEIRESRCVAEGQTGLFKQAAVTHYASEGQSK